MSWVNEDLNKLKHYCKSLGLTVKFLPGNKVIDALASYDPHDKSIEIFELTSQSKTFMILCLLHEIGHHREFLDRNQKDSDLLLSAMLADEPNKVQRLALYNSESFSAFYMPIISNELNLKIPKYKVEAEAKLDKWNAQCFYETGKHNTGIKNKAKRKELRKQCKKESITK